MQHCNRTYIQNNITVGYPSLLTTQSNQKYKCRKSEMLCRGMLEQVQYTRQYGLPVRAWWFFSLACDEYLCTYNTNWRFKCISCFILSYHYFTFCCMELGFIVRVIKSRRMRWAGHVARMWERRSVYRALVGKP